jgi:hypothetical protein
VWAEERWPDGRRLAGMEEKWAACGAMVCGISCAATLLFSLNPTFEIFFYSAFKK